MYYEISNVVFNHKLTKWEIEHANPFSKTTGRGKNKRRQEFFLTKDHPRNLFIVYSNGFCIKPHAFREDGDMFLNSIVLDFDNLTEIQCEFVKYVVNGKYEFKKMYGDYSSGMKTEMFQNEGIENWKPAKWKYKVFFPVENCISTYEDVNEKFIEAVAFFNPTRTMEEVRDVWARWRKANNRKDRISDPIFKDWILPDVQMANNTRNQITYSVDPSQPEKVKQFDDTWLYRHLPVAGAGKYTTTSKHDYRGLDWKIEESKPDIERKKPIDEAVEECEKIILANIHFPYDKFNLPISKAGFSRLLHRNHFTDLVVGSSGLTLLLSKVFKKHSEGTDLTVKMDDMKKDASLSGKCFARILAEIRRQGLTTSMKEEALQDSIRAFKEIHGQKVFNVLSKKETNLIVHEMARSFISAWLNYRSWRSTQRLMKVNVNPKVIEARNRWRDTKEEVDRDEFYRELNKDIMERLKESQKPEYDCPYDFHRRGFKAEVFSILMNGEVKIETPEDFISRMRIDIVPSSDGEYSDNLLRKWYVQYKTMWNRKYPENPIGRKSSKWTEMFKGKSQDEINEIIDSLEISKQMKYKLRKQYGR